MKNAFRDPLIEAERRVLAVQQKILDLLEPFSDDQRCRLIAAAKALLEKTPDEILYQIALRRAAALDSAGEPDDGGRGL